MTFLAPITALVAAGLAIPALVALYFLKLRRREVLFSTSMLWKKSIQDMQVNSPFEKLRKNLLLLLQLLMLVALLFAMARPTLRGPSTVGARVVVLIDRSACMNATDVSPTRLDEARRLANQIVDNAGTDDAASKKAGVMVVSFARSARIEQTFTNDQSLLHSGIAQIRATDESADLEPALQLIQPYAAEGVDVGQALTVFVISSGRVRFSERAGLAGADVRFVRIGKGTPIDVSTMTAKAVSSAPGNGTADPVQPPGAPSEDWVSNVGIVSLAARRDYKRPEQVQVFTSLANFGPQAVNTNLSLKIDGRVARVERITIPAAEGGPRYDPGVKSVHFEIELTGAALLELSHDFKDALESDNAAWLSLGEPHELRVLMVSAGNGFLEHAIHAAGVKQLMTVTPEKFQSNHPEMLTRAGWPGAEAIVPSGMGVDVAIFDHYSPAVTPGVDSLYFGAIPPIAGLKLIAPKESTPGAGTDLGIQRLLDWKRDHPLLRYTNMEDLVYAGGGRLSLPEGTEVVANGKTGPVMAVVTQKGVRHVVTSFELLKTNWPMQVGFPVFVSNALPWLALGGQVEVGVGYLPGEVAVVPVSGKTETVSYKGPVPITAPVTNGRATLPAFERAGLYQSTVGNGGSVVKPWDQLGVNLMDQSASDLRPALMLKVGQTQAAGQTGDASYRREVWSWFVMAALGVMVLEWWVYTTRMKV